MTTTRKMPDWLEPMAATLTQDRFVGRDWLFERKFDGIRLLAYKRGADVQLYSRNRLPQNLPAIAGAVGNLPVHEVILDGEMTWDRHIAAITSSTSCGSTDEISPRCRSRSVAIS